MNLIKKLKGYYRRLTTIKKDKNYKPDLKSYGDISVEFVDSIMINSSNYESNIVIKLQCPNEEGSKSDLNELINLITKSDLRLVLSEKHSLAYVYGRAPSYAKFLYSNEEMKSYNKYFSLLYNLCIEIDSIDPILQYLNNPKENIYETEKYYPYESENINISINNPIYVQDITAKLPEDQRNEFKCINALFVYDTNQADDSVYMYYASDIKADSILQSKPGDDLLKYDAPQWIEDYASNLTLCDGTNILKDNLLITNNDDQSLYDDIDEIIE